MCRSAVRTRGVSTKKQAAPSSNARLSSASISFDTANTYSDGTSEEIVGRALGDFARREEIVIATKVFLPNARRSHTRRLLTQIHPD